MGTSGEVTRVGRRRGSSGKIRVYGYDFYYSSVGRKVLEIPPNVTFIDLKKTYNSVSREAL